MSKSHFLADSSPASAGTAILIFVLAAVFIVGVYVVVALLNKSRRNKKNSS